MERILVKTPNWLGDAVMSIPAVNGINTLFPEADICVWTPSYLIPLWSFIPSAGRAAETVPKDAEFDLGILLTNSFGSALRMFFLNVKRRSGYAANGRGLFLTDPVPLNKRMRAVHQSEYFLNIVRYWGEFKPDEFPIVNIPQKVRDEAERLLAGYGWDGGPATGVHPCASYGPAKCWIPERFGMLIDRIKEKEDGYIFITGSKDDMNQIKYVLANVKDKSRIINLAGRTDIGMLAGVISLCRRFIANDSGPGHLAASLGVPVISIFGSTDPVLTAPRGNCTVVKKDMPCSPCFRRRCTRDMECMKKIETEDIADILE